MFRILTMNKIAKAGLDILAEAGYTVDEHEGRPDALLLRSANLHHWQPPASLLAIGRAGAGVNNIPLDVMSQQGIAVFNTPGANANAVKELVLAGMLLAMRHLPEALAFVSGLQGDDHALHEEVEAQKKRFVGRELTGKVLGVIGLGAIGVQVANAGVALGMRVIGYDNAITVERAWLLSSEVIKASSLQTVLGNSDVVSIHVPLLPETKNMITQALLAEARPGLILLNFSREGIVSPEVVREALHKNQLASYVTDFPAAVLRGQRGVIALPHLGASTNEAEENCAVMAAAQLRDYLEQGTVRHSVNLPECAMEFTEGYRLAIVHGNMPNMLGQISTHVAQWGGNIIDMINRSKGQLAYTLLDIDQQPDDALVQALLHIDGVRKVRLLGEAARRNGSQ